MRMTLDEIARMAGVSKATVSRVINNKSEGVGPETRKRVSAILAQINYDTAISISDRTGIRSHTIGLILPDITNPFFSELAREISSSAMEYGYAVILGNTGFSAEAEGKFITAMIAKKIDGMILVSSILQSTEAHKMLEKYHVPVLLLDRDVDGMKKNAMVLADNRRASYLCSELLIRNGSSKIAYITGSATTSTAAERLEGYKSALKHYQIPYSDNLIQQGDYTLESGYNALLNLERAGIKYSAILSANDLMALGAMKALSELGKKIPEEIEIIGYDNIVYGQYTDPPLTTVQQPTTEMGRKSVDLIIRAIEETLKSVECIRLQPRLLRRKTTR